MSPRFSFGRSTYRFSSGSSEIAVLSPVKNRLRTRDHYFVTFPSHLLDQDRDLHLATGIDLKHARCFCIIYLERNVATGFASQAFAKMSRGYEFSLTAGKRRVVHKNVHANRRRIDVHELKRRPFFTICEGFADINFLETGQPNDLASGRVFYFHLLQSLVSKERCHGSAFAPAITLNADD